MQFLHDINLFAHIGSGFMVLLTGLIPMLVQKGNKTHRRWGRVYYWAMFGVDTFVFSFGRFTLPITRLTLIHQFRV